MADDGEVSILCMLLLYCCTVLPCTVLQGIGLLTPFWIVDDSCDTVGLFLFYNCCAVNGTNGTDGCTPVIEYINGPLEFEATAFSCFLACSFCLFIMICVLDSTSCHLVISLFLFAFLYLLAGMLSLLGCLLIGVDKPTTSLGVSFYLCLAAGCYVLVQIIIVYIIPYFDGCKSDDNPDTYRMDVGLEYPAGPGQTDTGGGTAATTQDTDTGFPINFKAAQFVIPKMLQTVKDIFSMDS